MKDKKAHNEKLQKEALVSIENLISDNEQFKKYEATIKMYFNHSMLTHDYMQTYGYYYR